MWRCTGEGVSVCICVCIRGIWVRTTYYGLRLPWTRARTRELGGTIWHFGVEAYRCNPRWGSRTLGPPLAPLRGTRPLLPNNRHHRSYIMHTFPRDITIIELYYVSCYGYTYVHWVCGNYCFVAGWSSIEELYYLLYKDKLSLYNLTSFTLCM